jgi:hypothetical protein
LEASLATLQNTVTALQATVTTQASTIATLQTQLSTVNSSNVMALDPYLSVDTVSDARGPLVQFHGANVQVVNGSGSTATANGLGNLIIGYDEVQAAASYSSRCTIGTDPNTDVLVTDQASCTTAGGTWTDLGFKTGSHYLVMGSQNSYSRWGGIVAGFQNASTYDYASVSGGYYNTASGDKSSVSGGSGNIASGTTSSVSGGNANQASGTYSSASGGYANIASGPASNVSGGHANTASGSTSSVSGGDTNTASGDFSSVLGGGAQTAATLNLTIPALP